MSKPLNKKVFVGVSGGVDSSVALALLQEQGYDVYGVFIVTWHPSWLPCDWKQERRDAMRVCAHLNIPFLECNLESEYELHVAKQMIDGYKRGITPNPDVLCNQHVKFGGFLRFALERGADYIATGHYARRLTQNSCGEYVLAKGVDPSKDQSYFLWTLTQHELSKTLFPVGEYNKSTIRTMAQRYKLPTATKKDSQGICFLGNISMKEFLSHYIEYEQGNVLDQDGRVIGTHQYGARFFTQGERHGFTLHGAHHTGVPHYVVSRDIHNNTITVAPKSVSSNVADQKIVTLIQVNDPHTMLATSDNLTGAIRYHGTQYPCRLSYDQTGWTAIISNAGQEIMSEGQSLVIYKDELCIGGGVVDSVNNA